MGVYSKLDKKVDKRIIRFPLILLIMVAYRRESYSYHNKECCYDYREKRRIHRYENAHDYENYSYRHLDPPIEHFSREQRYGQGFISRGGSGYKKRFGGKIRIACKVNAELP